jgi:hypothetical protein
MTTTKEKLPPCPRCYGGKIRLVYNLKICDSCHRYFGGTYVPPSQYQFHDPKEKERRRQRERRERKAALLLDRVPSAVEIKEIINDGEKV